MKMLSIFILIFFVAALAVDCYFITVNNNDLRYISKGLLMPLLLIYFITETQHSQSKSSKSLLFAALLSSFTGDILLLVEHYHIYFVIGIGVFLITHILYTIFFLRIQPFEKDKGMLPLISGIIVIAYVIYISSLIWNGVSKDELEAPVVFYVMAISLMLITAINTLIGKVRKVGIRYFVPGALLFIASDSLLAVDKFANPFDNSSVLIILSYAAAQFLIVSGSIKVLKKQKSRTKNRRPGSVSV